MKLSIAMIVKNEERYIENTLIPLNKIKDYIESEIIIVDTGSTDSTVEIAKKYTDKIYFHKWNNNFSDMRNLSINYCSGEWILVVDADEVLYDVEELMNLINNKSFYKYNGGFIKIVDFKNNIQYSINNGSISPMLRLFKKNTVKYRGIIHEQPEYKGPVIDTNIRFIHYGYDNNDSKLMEYKFERNLKLLLDELKNNPREIYTNFQIATTYSMHKDLKEALKYIEIAYSEAKNNIDKYIYVIDKYCFILYNNNNYELLLEKSNEGIKHYKEYIDFYFYLGESYYKLNKYEEAIKAYNNYLDLFEKLKKGNTAINTTLSVKTREYKEYILYNLALSYYKCNLYEKALGIITKINDKDMLKDKALLILKIVIEGKVWSKINTLNEFIDKYNYDDILLYIHKEVLIEDLQDICKAELEGSIKEIVEIINYFKENNTINETYKEKIKNIIDHNESPYSIYVYYILKYDIEEVNEFICYGKDKIEEILLDLCTSYYDFNEIILEGLQKIKSDKLSNIIIRTIMQRAVILGGNLSVDMKKSLFLNYILEKYYYILKLYNKKLIQENIWILPAEERFIIEMKNSLSYKYKDTLKYIKSIKNTLTLEKSYSEYIKLLIEDENESIIDDQVKAFIPQLVKSIEEFINNKNYQAAYDTVEEGLSLVKFDFDLMMLKYNLLLNFNYKKEAYECLKDIILYGDSEKVIRLIDEL